MATKICSNCGRVINRNDSRQRKNYFCNFICKAQWQSKQPKEAHPRWREERFNGTCSQCGKPIYIQRSRIERGDKNHFCSKQCSDIFKTGKPQDTKREFVPHPSRRKKFPMQCRYCEKTVMIAPSKLQGRDHFYCSFKCRSAWISENKSGANSHAWRGGHKRYYGNNWNQQRAAARKRDNYTCQHCGITEGEYGKELDVHHKKPFVTFGYVPGSNENYKQANRLENLITLCGTCHHKAEPVKILFQMQMFGMKAVEVLRSAKKNKPWKRCTRCGKTKPVTDFGKSQNRVDGLYPYCKQCKKEYASDPVRMEKRRIQRRTNHKN